MRFRLRALGAAALAAALCAVNIAPASAVTLDFKTQDDFVTPLVNGESVSTPPKFGNLVSITSFGAQNRGAAIFDSTFGGPNATGPDPDLVVGLGNVLILQSRLHQTQTVAGIFDTPDDSADGGTIFFDFVNPVFLSSLTLVDIDANGATALTLTDGAGLKRIYSVPNNWTFDINSEGPLGYDILDFTTLAPQPGEAGPIATATEDLGFDSDDVRRLQVTFNGSAGLTNLQFSEIPEPSTLILVALAGALGLRRRRA